MQLRPHQEQALQAMTNNDKGQVIVPTGGGKTMCMIMDAVKQLEDYGTVVVVAPRILLAEQLSHEFMEIIDEKYNDVDVMHVHSGKIKGVFSTTNPLEIQGFVEQNLVNFFSRTIIFTTYHSLHRIARRQRQMCIRDRLNSIHNHTHCLSTTSRNNDLSFVIVSHCL